VTRLWERHLLNSAAVAQFLPTEGRLIDIGSGAGLPGVVLAAMLPGVDVTLLEPMERRADWLIEVVSQLGLANAQVRRGRAEELHGELQAEAVTARAVAPMDRLGRLAMPLLVRGGVLVALKGRQAADEVGKARGALKKMGAGGPGNSRCTDDRRRGQHHGGAYRARECPRLVVRPGMTEMDDISPTSTRDTTGFG